MTDSTDLPTLDELCGVLGGTVEGNVLRDAVVAGETCNIFPSKWGGYKLTSASTKHSRRDLQRYLDMHLDLPRSVPLADNDNDPVDLWARASHPVLPPDLLPNEIADFAHVQADIMGVDPERPGYGGTHCLRGSDTGQCKDPT